MKQTQSNFGVGLTAGIPAGPVRPDHREFVQRPFPSPLDQLGAFHSLSSCRECCSLLAAHRQRRVPRPGFFFVFWYKNRRFPIRSQTPHSIAGSPFERRLPIRSQTPYSIADSSFDRRSGHYGCTIRIRNIRIILYQSYETYYTIKSINCMGYINNIDFYISHIEFLNCNLMFLKP